MIVLQLEEEAKSEEKVAEVEVRLEILEEALEGRSRRRSTRFGGGEIERCRGDAEKRVGSYSERVRGCIRESGANETDVERG